ncbi:armadillo-type protein [Chlamydoabsidia padenii]|nr:armadillo-type protein [Chlamydoabsidia padenii]
MDIDLPSLQFNEPLVGSKPIKIDVLKQRLETLHKELQSFEQMNVDTSSLATISKDLINKRILQHKNSTVSALAACCIADVLRLHAPDPPYNETELKLVFESFISQLGDMDKNNKVDFQYQFYLLESLSTVKSILIMADLEGADDMMTQLFNQSFDIIEKRLPQNVQVCLTDILAQLVDEVPLSQESVEILLEHLACDDRLTNTRHAMAVDLCRMTPDVLQRRVCQYFTETLMTVSHTGEDGMDDLKRVHVWIQKIYFVMPSLLLNVIPQLQEELTLDELEVRKLAMETIGNMFTEKSSALFRQYPGVWKSWLERRLDKSGTIRASWAEIACLIYHNHPDIAANDINECLAILLRDPDEKVRTSLCNLIGSINIKTIVGYMSPNVLKELSMRCKDTKNVVQKAAMDAVGGIYNQVYSQLNEPKVMKKFGRIPQDLFHCLFVGNRRLDIALDETLQKYIFPENLDDAARTERLVTVFMSLDEKEKKAFYSYMARGKRNIELMESFLSYCDNDGMDSVISDYEQTQMDKLMKTIAAQFEDQGRVISCLKQIRDMDDLDVIRSLRSSINVEKEYKTILNAQNNLVRLMEQRLHDSSIPCKWILNRTHLLVINKSIVPYLYSALRSIRGNRQSAVQERSVASQTLAKKIGVDFPSMCLPYADELIKHIMNDDGGAIVDISLEVLASTTKSLPMELTLISKTMTRLVSYASNGSLHQAKYATTILCNSKEPEATCTELLEELIDELSLDNPNLVATLTSVSVIATYFPLVLQTHMDSLTSFIYRKCLKQRLPVSNSSNNPEWDDYDNLHDISKQKLAAVPVLSNYLMGMAKCNQPVENEMVLDVISMLWEMVDTTCDTAVANRTNAAETSHLRILAGSTIVQLGEYPAYQNTLDVARFEQLGLLLQDSCYYVRYQFGEFLMLGLAKAEINSRYQILLFLCAHEPEDSFLQWVAHFIRGRAGPNKEDRACEFSIDRLIHLLAHHPDFGSSDEELETFAQYIDFYISCITTHENITPLYYYVQRIKLSVDALEESYTKNSQILCELAALLLERRAKRSGWQIESGRQTTKLHSKLYKPLPVGPAQKQALEQTYISDDLATKIRNSLTQKGIEKRTRGEGVSHTSSKRTKRA